MLPEDRGSATAWRAGADPFGVLTRSEETDDRLFALMRCLLAYAALAIVYIDPGVPQRYVAANYGVLAVYCAFATLVAIDTYARRRLPWREWLHWTDIVFASILMYLSEATGSVFFFIYFFAIIVGSFTHGYAEGVRVIAVSLLLFVAMAIASGPWAVQVELDRTLLRPVYLLTLGYMIAVWGGRQLVLKRRLFLLKEANTFDPRYGAERALQVNLNRLLDFYSAERCVLALRQGDEDDRWVMYTLTSGDPAGISARQLTPEAARTLLCFDAVHSIVYDEAHAGRRGPLTVPLKGKQEEAPPSQEACAAVAGLLESPRFASVPCCEGDAGRGRLFVAGSGSRFGASDLQFLLQYVDTLATVVKNIRLLDELVLEAAAHERSVISHNLHDATIQPYVGLRLALEALEREAGPENPLAEKIRRLLDQANATIRDLRSYTLALREGDSLPTGSLQSALESVAERYRRFYGIEVHLRVDLRVEIQGRIAADAFYIVLEGLSNILKHTTAKKAGVNIVAGNGMVSITICSEGGEQLAAAAAFAPRSITARAHGMGGTVWAEARPDGSSVVTVELPFDTGRSPLR
jgi:signal transduction histidine kinase